MMRAAICVVLVLFFACQVDARPRRRGRRTTNYVSTTYSSYGSPAAAAATKAQRSANGGVKGAHLGGGYGGGNAEGVAFSTYSAQDALNKCCFTGQRPVAASHVVRGRDGWYAVKIYW